MKKLTIIILSGMLLSSQPAHAVDCHTYEECMQKTNTRFISPHATPILLKAIAIELHELNKNLKQQTEQVGTSYNNLPECNNLNPNNCVRTL